MKQVLIVEHNTNPLTANENAMPSKGKYILEGEFTRFDVKNRNERIYTAEKFLPALEELQERMSTLGVVYGELDHPDDFSMSLSRTSHAIRKIEYLSEQNIVHGSIQLLSTQWGKDARSIIYEDGLPLFVSSRAAGVTEGNGTVTLRKLFTYDLVSDPGFGSAKMAPINESLGLPSSKNYRIYEMSDDSKINDLFNMNKNDFVTKKHLSEYSEHLVEQIQLQHDQIKRSIKSGKASPAQLQKMIENYESLQETQSKMVDYLDYLSDKIQVVVNENISLKDTTKRLIDYNNYLAENLDKNIEYSEYLAENLDKNIEYSEYLAENLDKNIEYSEYIAENLDKNIQYSEYIAENLDKNIEYSEYLAENLDKNIEYSEYIAENLDRNIQYSEYIAENLDNNIQYSDYLAENLEGNIKYSEYLAENLDDNIAYSGYLAENLDKSIQYSGRIVEGLKNNGKVFENKNDFPTLEDIGFEYTDDEMDIDMDDVNDDDIYAQIDMGDEDALDVDGQLFNDEEDEEDMDDDYFTGESSSELSDKIDKLIQEAKKRKVSETSDSHFLRFLSKSQVNSYYDLTNEEQEMVKMHINESGNTYFSATDVINLINEALMVKNESPESKLVRLMPENMKPLWEQMNESSKKSIFSQAKLYPNLETEDQIKNFWETRNFKKNESVTKKLVAHDAIINEDKLSDSEFNAIMERIKNV